ncbi:hypothetical protein [Streptomyces sp. NPDC006368]|uniref:hypothetical protein n=1 Tax=Streptomyces sp. NPDC006368 TaxID=3156760 RepID=UPI0033B17772
MNRHESMDGHGDADRYEDPGRYGNADPRGRDDRRGDDDRHGNTVDQIVFRWDADNASGGFGPVAWSRSAEMADAVFRHTGALLRPTGQDTEPALLRLQYGDSVLLVHRSPWRDAGGRASTLCHALVGAAELLDPVTCLGLHAWCWKGSKLPPDVRGTLPTVPGGALWPTAVEGQLVLARTLPRARDELTGAVAEFLRHPEARFTLLDPSGGERAHRVLWGLHGIFGGYVEKGWTFATHDTAETDDVRFVFLSRWAGAPYGNGARRRVNPLERLGDRADEVAHRLVRRHLRDVQEDGGQGYEVSTMLQAVAAERRPGALVDVAERALAALEADARPAVRQVRVPAETADPPPPANPPVSPPLSPPLTPASPASYAHPAPEHEPSDAPSAAPEWPVPRGRSRALRRRVRRPRERRPGRLLDAVSDPYEPVPRDVLAAAPDADVLRALRKPVHYEVLTQLIEEAAERWPSWNRETRTRLCVVLLDRELFLTDRSVALGDPGGDVRAANAASLYRWAIRPLLGDPRIADRLAVLLPRLSTGPLRSARAAVRRIVESDEPRLPEAAWQALLMAAYREGPPVKGRAQPSATPAPAGSPSPVRAEPRTAPHAEPRTPARPAAGHEPHRPHEPHQQAQDGRLILIALSAAFVILLLALIALLAM